MRNAAHPDFRNSESVALRISAVASQNWGKQRREQMRPLRTPPKMPGKRRLVAAGPVILEQRASNNRPCCVQTGEEDLAAA